MALPNVGRAIDESNRSIPRLLVLDKSISVAYNCLYESDDIQHFVIVLQSTCRKYHIQCGQCLANR